MPIDPQTVEEWMDLARQWRLAARKLSELPETQTIAWTHAGFACECLLKAAIMAQERLNSWPSRAARKELYTHNLVDLAKVLRAKISPFDPVAPKWAVVTQWRRADTYVSAPMNPKVVADLLAAAFDKGGVEEWIFENYLKAYK
ncbi:hypothetical protein GCM10017322_38660 [Paracoccus aerius]|nr:hypothetical protein GCM10017322_38660 [Paracoccus aerius]